jgi:hypothetical protein
MRKPILFLLLVFCIKISYAQNGIYLLPKPPNWSAERFSFPLSFAPQINFTGNEELRFTPGWGNSKSDEYWAYTFLWFIKGKPALNQDTLNHYLTQYYNGLYLSNLKNKKTVPPASFTMADIKSIHRLQNDAESYEGKITTLDFLTGQPITFYTRIHVRGYPQMNCTGILFEVSPQDYAQPVWIKMNNLVAGFSVKVDKEF